MKVLRFSRHIIQSQIARLTAAAGDAGAATCGSDAASVSEVNPQQPPPLIERYGSAMTTTPRSVRSMSGDETGAPCRRLLPDESILELFVLLPRLPIQGRMTFVHRWLLCAGARCWAGTGLARKRGPEAAPSRLGSAASHISGTLERSSAPELPRYGIGPLDMAPRYDSAHEVGCWCNLQYLQRGLTLR
jgi:hypothetical protein